MGRISEVLCAAASGNRVYLAARDKSSQLHLIRSTTNPLSFADAQWELYTKEPHRDTVLQSLGPTEVSCAAGDDGSFVIMALRRYTEADNSSTFWGATYNYNFEATHRSEWKPLTSSIRCKTASSSTPSDSCNHMVLAARSRLDYHSKFVHVAYQDSILAVQISPLVEDGFRNYTSPIPVTPPLKDLVLFSYIEGSLANLRLGTDAAANTISLNVQSFGTDLVGIPLPNRPPTSNITFPMEQYCYTENKYVGKLGGTSGDKMYFWCQSYRSNSGIYEYDGSKLTRIADVQRNTDSYNADSYLPAPAIQQPATASTRFSPPTWGLILREGKMYSVTQGAGRSDSGLWQDSGNPLAIDIDRYDDSVNSGLSHVAIAFIAVGSVLAISLIAGLGFIWWYRRRRARTLALQEDVYLDGGPMDDPFGYDHLYTPPWNSVGSLPPPYAPPEEHPMSETEQQQQEQQEQGQSHAAAMEQSNMENEEYLTHEHPREPPPSVETDTRSSQATLNDVPLPQADRVEGAPSHEPPRDSSLASDEDSPPPTALGEMALSASAAEDETCQNHASIPHLSEESEQDHSLDVSTGETSIPKVGPDASHDMK
ncbi:hypothetical protein BGZ73_004583 [Actinomortierella ambigua]|nr:hypothetical protein BGZ73_004583 [Actinomortierella ambigua]